MSCRSMGISFRQGSHHEAQKSMTVILLPFTRLITFSYSPSGVASVKSGMTCPSAVASMLLMDCSSLTTGWR